MQRTPIYDEHARIIRNEQLASTVFRLTLAAPAIAAAAKPGQFVMIRVANLLDPLLRRPLSIHQVFPEQGTLQIVLKVIGKGTAILAGQPPEKRVQVLGPLGRGFDSTGSNPACLVGGGIGAAPLLFLAQALGKTLPQRPLLVLLGARGKDELIAVGDFEATGARVLTATDDGSSGHHGFITELMAGEIMAGQQWSVFCCGPLPMMKAAAKQCRARGWRCQVSLETTMVCGTGACLGCAIEMPPASGKYLQICQKGPVFDATEVSW